MPLALTRPDDSENNKDEGRDKVKEKKKSTKSVEACADRESRPHKTEGTKDSDKEKKQCWGPRGKLQDPHSRFGDLGAEDRRGPAGQGSLICV